MALNAARKRVHCHQCRYYFVTWDRNAPHGCRKLGFKSQPLPNEIVYKSSGLECLQFAPKGRVHPVRK